MDKEKSEEYITVTVTLPKWLYDRSVKIGLDLSAVLQEALIKKLEIEKRP